MLSPCQLTGIRSYFSGNVMTLLYICKNQLSALHNLLSYRVNNVPFLSCVCRVILFNIAHQITLYFTYGDL